MENFKKMFYVRSILKDELPTICNDSFSEGKNMQFYCQ